MGFDEQLEYLTQHEQNEYEMLFEIICVLGEPLSTQPSATLYARMLFLIAKNNHEEIMARKREQVYEL